MFHEIQVLVYLHGVSVLRKTLTRSQRFLYLLLARKNSAHIRTVWALFGHASGKDVYVIKELLFGKWKQDAKSFPGTLNHAVSIFTLWVMG